MTLLIGHETKEAAGGNITKEFAFTEKYECEVSGKLEEIKLWSKGVTSKTEIDIGIYDDNAGKPGTLKAHKLAPGMGAAETGIVTASGFSVELEKGKTYWLAALPVSATVTPYYKKTVGKEEVLKASSATKAKELSEAQNYSTKEAESELLSIWGLGTETAAGLKGKATGTLKLLGTAKGFTAEVLKGKATGTLTLGGTSKGAAASVVRGKATGALLLTGTSKGATAEVLKGKATGALLLTGTSKGSTTEGGVVKGKAAGTLTLRGTAKGATAEVLKGKASGPLTFTGTAKGATAEVLKGKAAGTLTLTGTAQGSTAAVVNATATGTLLLTGTSTGTAGGALLGKAAGTLYLTGRGKGRAKGAEGKKVILFVFDE